MSGPDSRTPGHVKPDFKIGHQIPQELSSADYYAGLSTRDAYRVSLFVNLIRRSEENVGWQYAVMAYGSTTRHRDRSKARDIDLKILNTAEGEERSEAASHIRESIRVHYERLRVPFQEFGRTFKWDSVHPYESFGDQVSNEDPSFVVHSSLDTPGLPLHISIAGNFTLPASEKIELMRSDGGRSFAILLEPRPAQTHG